MANTFIIPSVIAARGIATLYNTTVLAALVWRDFDEAFTGKQGDTVTIRKPSVFEAENFNRAAGITLQEVDEDSTTVTLDKIANVSVAVTDEEMTLEISDFQEQILTPAIEAIVQKVDGEIAEALIDAAIAEGQQADMADDPATVDEANYVFRKARAILGRNKLPVSDRHAVLSPEASAAALGDKLLISVDQSGATDALREGHLGRLLGFMTYESQVLGEGGGNRGQADGVAFHRTAVTLATRPLQTPRGLPDSGVARRNFKSLSLRVTYAYNHNKKQDEVSVDMLYGIAVTRPEGAVELDFGQGS